MKLSLLQTATAAPYTVPAPVITFDGPRAVITGVRFSWMDHCHYCRKAVRTHTDGGTIRMGLEMVPTANKGETARWYERQVTNVRPTPPPYCCHCGNERGFGQWSFRAYMPIDDHTALVLVSNAWVQLRREYPDLTNQADLASHRAQHTVNGQDRNTWRREPR